MSATHRARSSAMRCRVAPPWPLRRADAAARLLLCAALALTATADCSFSSANHPPPRPQAPRRPNQRVPPSPLPRRPTRAQRALLKLNAATAAAAADFEATDSGDHAAARPVSLEASQLSAVVQVQQAWGAWAGNSNATTACSAWPGVTCSPDGLIVALDSKAVSVDGSTAMPDSITNLSALQYLDLTNDQLAGPIPSLASLTALTLLAMGADGSQLSGTLEGLTWLSSLSNLHTLKLVGLADFTGDLSSLHVLSHMGKLQSLTLSSFTNATGEIPREIRYLTALTALDLSYLRALEFPDWVTHLASLQRLNVNADEPRRQGLLSDDISHLTALTSLSLTGNNLEGYVPKSCSSLLNLQYL
ncbi:unnamed protein product, partial [Closterium sp. Yama58-4]